MDGSDLKDLVLLIIKKLVVEIVSFHIYSFTIESSLKLCFEHVAHYQIKSICMLND